MSGGLATGKLLKGGVVEKRLRTTVLNVADVDAVFVRRKVLFCLKHFQSMDRE